MLLALFGRASRSASQFRTSQLCSRFMHSTPWQLGCRGVVAPKPRADQQHGRFLCSAAQPQESLQVWGIRMNLENLYLSWTRNSIIATVAGLAMTTYKLDVMETVPIGGPGFLLLGCSFMMLGPLQYLHSYWRLKQILALTMGEWALVAFNASWFPAMWTFSMWCFVRGAPESINTFLVTHLHRGSFLPQPATQSIPPK